jgi:hypothetical protein
MCKSVEDREAEKARVKEKHADDRAKLIGVVVQRLIKDNMLAPRWPASKKPTGDCLKRYINATHQRVMSWQEYKRQHAFTANMNVPYRYLFDFIHGGVESHQTVTTKKPLPLVANDEILKVGPPGEHGAAKRKGNNGKQGHEGQAKKKRKKNNHASKGGGATSHVPPGAPHHPPAEASTDKETTLPIADVTITTSVDDDTATSRILGAASRAPTQPLTSMTVPNPEVVLVPQATTITTELHGGTSVVNEDWIQCDKCDKWRRCPLAVLEEHEGEGRDQGWDCSLNTWDAAHANCNVPQEE